MDDRPEGIYFKCCSALKLGFESINSHRRIPARGGTSFGRSRITRGARGEHFAATDSVFGSQDVSCLAQRTSFCCSRRLTSRTGSGERRLNTSPKFVRSVQRTSALDLGATRLQKNGRFGRHPSPSCANTLANSFRVNKRRRGRNANRRVYHYYRTLAPRLQNQGS
jgi:hypothetical protein